MYVFTLTDVSNQVIPSLNETIRFLFYFFHVFSNLARRLFNQVNFSTRSVIGVPSEISSI